jgi:lactoylglutathione lyase
MTPLTVHHVALWVADLDRMRSFYVSVLGGASGAVYENPRTGFRSCFVTFGGCRLELMWPAGREEAGGEASRAHPAALGWAHVALSAGGRAGVDARVAELRKAGVAVVGEPRVTGDGYYEAVIEDPEGNRIEIVG